MIFFKILDGVVSGRKKKPVIFFYLINVSCKPLIVLAYGLASKSNIK